MPLSVMTPHPVNISTHHRKHHKYSIMSAHTLWSKSMYIYMDMHNILYTHRSSLTVSLTTSHVPQYSSSHYLNYSSGGLLKPQKIMMLTSLHYRGDAAPPTPRRHFYGNTTRPLSSAYCQCDGCLTYVLYGHSNIL